MSNLNLNISKMKQYYKLQNLINEKPNLMVKGGLPPLDFKVTMYLQDHLLNIWDLIIPKISVIQIIIIFIFFKKDE